MKYYIIAALVMFSFTACAQTNDNKPDLSQYHNDTYITCINHLDHSEVDYLKSKRKDVPSTVFNHFMISEIVDINGKHIQINEAEWTNYTCTSQVLN